MDNTSNHDNLLIKYLKHEVTLDQVMKYYNLSSHGFVPESNDVCLPDNYQDWEEACRKLPLLIKNKTLPEVIEELPLISTEELISLDQKRRAYLILCMMGNGYLWMYGRDKDNIPKKLPENIAYPWYRVSMALGLKPILTHAAVDLYNCVPKNSNDSDSQMVSDPDMMDCLFTLTGTRDEKWFYLIMSTIELEGAKSIPVIFDLLIAVANNNSNNNNNNEIITDKLYLLADGIKNVEQILKRTLEKDSDGRYKCDPQVFWNELRIYLGGTSDPSLFPDGLEFESISSDSKGQSNGGGSAAQSSLIQLMDALLGVAHVSTHTRKFLLSMRYYMPKAHRYLLEDMESVCKLRDYVMMSNDQAMTEAFDLCINRLTSFRKYHYYIVQRYIIDNLPAEAQQAAKGTGGTSLTGFLIISKDETQNTVLTEKL
jgi:indoleamine 2,3-dioxygenase